ncbi:MAG: GtrA family protein [Acidimicrobiales bacterium]
MSIVSLGIGQLLLLGLHSGAGLDAWAANTIAVTVSAIPAYVLYRHVVWAKRSPSDLRREILPFWAMAFIGLLLSTVAVALAERWFGGAVAVNAAYVGAFGSLWVLKYVALERWLFGAPTASTS